MKRIAPMGIISVAILALAACSSDPEDSAPIETRAPSAAPSRSSASAAYAAAAERDCFDIGAVNGFTVVDEDTVRFSVGANRAYDIDARRGVACANLRWANAIGVVPDPASAFICVNDQNSGARIRTDRGDECLIQTVRRALSDTAPPVAPAPGDGAE